MLRKSLIVDALPGEITIQPRDKLRMVWIATSVIIQCLVVFSLSTTVFYCVWSPYHARSDHDILPRIMYLHDPSSCGDSRASKSIKELVLSSNTYGLRSIRPIKRQPPIVTVSTRLSSKFTRHVELSLLIHSIWFVMAVALRVVARSNFNVSHVKFVLKLFFYASCFVIVFDLSMGIVYISHIQQSLTKGMILRYSGWSVELKLDNYDEFGAWVPLVASLCWTRGVIILFLNIYSCKVIYRLRKRIKRTEFKRKMIVEENLPIPDSDPRRPENDDVLYYRKGDIHPYVINKA